MKHTVYIQDYLPAIVATRSAIASLKEQVVLSINDTYIFDFTNITFISRSFADEFLKFVKSSNVSWSYDNANSNIIAMLEAVEHSQKSVHKDYDIVAMTSFSSQVELNEFLATI